MPVDPQIQVLLDKGTGVPATHMLTVVEARAQYEARLQRHREGLMALTQALGWTFATHRTDRATPTALLALYTALARPAKM